MSRYLVTLRSTADRERALRFIAAAPFGSRVEVKAIKRSMPQNDGCFPAPERSGQDFLKLPAALYSRSETTAFGALHGGPSDQA